VPRMNRSYSVPFAEAPRKRLERSRCLRTAQWTLLDHARLNVIEGALFPGTHSPLPFTLVSKYRSVSAAFFLFTTVPRLVRFAHLRQSR